MERHVQQLKEGVFMPRALPVFFVADGMMWAAWLCAACLAVSCLNPVLAKEFTKSAL